ncbi:nucleic acid-binding protein [Violaceomyces palustris]|uniref:Nucleic acid-binding protein n=1 Tax=Violaceomyces palustris TaxID=1673888 RepID=A0ACD0P8Q4_9BASI|nr:nucleic acid-binding protein [Violaceomyces palustris]
MPGVKRPRDEAGGPSSSSLSPSASKKAAKPRKSTSNQQTKSSQPAPRPSFSAPHEVDFPRGGGTGLTPLEYREAKREARAEIDSQDNLFKDDSDVVAIAKSKKLKQKINRERNNDKKKGRTRLPAKEEAKKPKLDYNRVEHLNYKRLLPGARVLCSVLAVHPLAVVVSLPNQLLGHIPVTQISPQFTERLQRAADASDDEEMNQESDDDEGEGEGEEDRQRSNQNRVPELREIFRVGQWIRASVLAVHSAGVTKGTGAGREGGEYEKESRRVVLTMAPQVVNEGVSVSDLLPGATLAATVSSIEDHGYLLDSGIDELSGFLSYKEAAKLAEFEKFKGKGLQVGRVVETRITKIAENQRTFECTIDPVSVKDSVVKAGPGITAIVPGMLVSALVTASLPSGLNVKLFGMFDATIDRFHLPAIPEGKDVSDVYKEGSKHKARVIWDLPTPEDTGLDSNAELADGDRKFGLSMAPQVVRLEPPSTEEGELLSESFPIGTQVDCTVVRTDSDWGLTCAIKGTDIGGFVHISRVADEHITALSANTGAWKVGTHHVGRVIGHAPTDKILQLSLQPSVLEKKFMRVSEVEVGEIIKATVKKVKQDAIFLQLNGNVDGVVFALHFSDIILKNPEKKYKPGVTVKARVLSVDPGRNRITLTLKKSLVDSDLPVVSSIQDARVGIVTHATVSRLMETSLLVDLYGGLRALVPASEVSEAYTTNLRESFFEGKVVKVRLTNVDYNTHRLTASIKQASPSFLARLNVDAVELGEKVVAQVNAVHQDVVVLTLQPSEIRALVSLAVLSQLRATSIDDLRESLEEGEEINDLIVVSKNSEKGLVILGTKLRSSGPSSGPSVLVKAGDLVNARVIQRNDDQQECIVMIQNRCRGRLHLTDCSDDFSDPESARLPELDTMIQCVVLAVRGNGKKADVSTRPSQIAAAKGETMEAKKVEDRQISSVQDLKKGEKYRGYVKTITDAGLFVNLGRSVTARVQIRELFDNFVKDWKPRFVKGQVVEGTVLEIDAEQGKVELSLKKEPGVGRRSNEKKAKKPDQMTVNDFKKGDKVKGFIRGISEFGVFVQIEGTDVSGLCHKSQISDNTEVDALKAFHIGDRVRAIVIDVQSEKKKISFGLKPSYFDAEDFEESDDEVDDEGDDVEEKEEEDEDEEEDEILIENGEGGDDEDDDDEDEDMLDEEADGSDSEGDFLELDDQASVSEEEKVKSTKSGPASSSSSKPLVPALALAGGFSWSAPEGEDSEAESEAASSDDEDDEDETGASGQQNKKKKRRKGKGKALEEDLTADLATKAPESNNDFERLLLGSPNSSFLWIQFMSFQLQLSDVEKARDVGRRALKVISYREEQEKMNVWIALLNLENTYGTQESLESTFKDAVQANDAKTIHLKMISIYEKTDKVEEAEELFKKTAKKFGHSSKVWVLWGQFMLRHDRPEDARKLLPRSLQSLEKRKHVKTIISFALSEFKMGEPERGRTIFEGLVDSYSKRLDIWWQYIDQEAKLDNIAGVRSLFERVLGLKQSSKKAKSVLKKWLDFEKRKGTKEGQQAVLDRARKFVEEMQAKQQGDDDHDADVHVEDQHDE